MTSHLDKAQKEHEELYLLLPWFANQTLADSEHERVRAHLKTCLVCRRELNGLKALQSPEPWSAFAATACIDVDESFSRLLGKLPARSGVVSGPSNIHPLPSRKSAGIGASRSSGGRHKAVWLALAATLLLALQIPGGPWLQPAPDFRTLANPDQAKSLVNGPVLRVAFRSELPRPKLEALLAEAGALLMSGPDAGGAVSVRALGDGVAANAQGELVAKLKSMKEVLSVEPIPEVNLQ